MNGVRRPRRTARASTSSSSVVTAIVDGYPSTVIAPESPTSTMSTPAASAARALGKSYAVTITIGSARRFLSSRIGRVTGSWEASEGTLMWGGAEDTGTSSGQATVAPSRVATSLSMAMMRLASSTWTTRGR